MSERLLHYTSNHSPTDYRRNYGYWVVRPSIFVRNVWFSQYISVTVRPVQLLLISESHSKCALYREYCHWARSGELRISRKFPCLVASFGLSRIIRAQYGLTGDTTHSKDCACAKINTQHSSIPNFMSLRSGETSLSLPLFPLGLAKTA